MAPERLSGWVDRFVERHGAVTEAILSDMCLLMAADGAQARISIGWGGLPRKSPRTLDNVIDHLTSEHRVGVLLARRASHAVGVYDGRKLTASKVGSHYVQSKTKAGGWSQQRYARRRSNQARDAASGAAEDLLNVVWERRSEWDWFVTGGEATAVRQVLLRTPGLAALAPYRVLPTPDPRHAVLEAFPAQYRAVPISLNELA